jgi:hypothetical protein
MALAAVDAPLSQCATSNSRLLGSEPLVLVQRRQLTAVA